jgi:hypothetical protein
MAVWQFQFTVIPVAGIIKIHGEMVGVIPQFAARMPDAIFDEHKVYPDYWEGIDKTAIHALVKRLLPVAESWSDEAFMYGNSKIDDIQIWEDSVYVRLNCSSLNVELLENIVAIANDLNYCIVLSEGGRVIAPMMQLMIDAINASSASKFIKNPKAFLESTDRIFGTIIG